MEGDCWALAQGRTLLSAFFITSAKDVMFSSVLVFQLVSRITKEKQALNALLEKLGGKMGNEPTKNGGHRAGICSFTLTLCLDIFTNFPRELWMDLDESNQAYLGDIHV